MEIGDALARYLRHHRALGSSQKTIDWHRDSIGGLEKWLAEKYFSTDMSELTVLNVRDWIVDMRDRGLAQKTVQTRIASIKAFSAWLADADGGATLDHDPLARLPRPRVDDVAPTILTPQDVTAILAACDRRTVTGRRDYALLLLLYSTAIRSAEARNLTNADVDWRAGGITVRRGKGGKSRVVPLTAPVDRALQHYLTHPLRRRFTAETVFLTDDGTPLTTGGFRQIFKRLEQRTGIRCNPHRWRHSAAVQYLRNGGKLETLRLLLGHSTLMMTLHYARLAGVDVINGHDTADPLRAVFGRGAKL